MRFKINLTDIIIFSITIIFSISLLFSFNYLSNNLNEDLYVDVNIDGNKIYSYKIDEDRTIILLADDYPSLLGNLIIEIKDSKVRVVEETSPNNYCSLKGYIEKAYTSLVCLPNGVIITIVGNSESDVVMPS